MQFACIEAFISFLKKITFSRYFENIFCHTYIILNQATLRRQIIEMIKHATKNRPLRQVSQDRCSLQRPLLGRMS